MKTRTSLAIAFLLAAAGASAAADEPLQLPVASNAGETISSRIDPAGDVDRYTLYLVAGDVLQVSSKESAPSFGLASNLHLFDPSGADVTPTVKGQNKPKASFKYTTATTGTHLVTLSGGTSGGRIGAYQLALVVTRVKPAVGKFTDAAGGTISVPFTTPAGSLVTFATSTKKGGFDLTQITRPDATPEPGFTAALKTKNRLKASLTKFPLTGGEGSYELKGAYDAGSKLTIKLTVVANDKKRKRKLNDELRIDPQLAPFPPEGITGTMFSVSGINFDDFAVTDDDGHVIGHRYPTFSLGGIVVPAESVEHPNGAVYTFPVPALLAPNQFYDLTIVNSDGQGQTAAGIFYLAGPPSITGLSIDTAGPAGGRTVRISGVNLRAGSSVTFDSTIVAPVPGSATSDHLDVIAPAHPPGHVTLKLRDDFGQLAAYAPGFTFLDIPSNRMTSISPTFFQAVGGEKVTVNGADFDATTVLTLDGAVVPSTLVSGTKLEFIVPPHPDAFNVKLRVTDSYEQTSAVDVAIKGFQNITVNSIPDPVTTTDAIDGWRATRVLAGDVDGDTKVDLVLLRPEKAFGQDANRSRLRLLLGSGSGVFSDATVSKIPAVSGDEDWRAQDGVLADLDGDDDLDLAIITDDAISGGATSSLRILRNDGSGGFTDVTSTAAPASTSYGDRNQGVAIAVGNFDGVKSSLVIVRDDKFKEEIVIPGGPPNPPNPPPQDTIITNWYPGTRVLMNDTHGVFGRKITALPTVTETSAVRFQGTAVAVGNVDGQNRDDIVVTRAIAPDDPANPGGFLLAAALLVNDSGNAVFSDATAAKLPAKSGAEYLQGGRVHLADLEGDGDLDLVVVSISRLVNPVDGTVSTAPAVRVLWNNGSGTFALPAGQVLPDADEDDSSQAEEAVVADFTGDGKADLFVVSSRAPNFNASATRALVQVDGAWRRGTAGLPNPVTGNDDLRGAGAAAADIDGDGDLDFVIVRDEANDTVRNTLVLKNPRK